MSQTSLELTELPFNLPGRIFRSPMPFQDTDPDGKIFQQFLKQKISVIVLLASDEECLKRTGRNLRYLYRSKGMEVVHLPITDFSIPSRKELEGAILTTLRRAKAGKHIAIHCYAGIGRTGMYTACLARRVLGLKGLDAVAWVRQYIPGALETEEQIQFVVDYSSPRQPGRSPGGMF